MIKVAVIGLRLEALLAAWVLRQHPHLDVWLICDRQPIALSASEDETNQASIPHSESMGNLLRALDVAHSSYVPQDGILLRGRIEEFPRGLHELAQDDAERVVRDAHNKASEEFVSMRRLLSRRRHKQRRLRCSSDELIKALSHRARAMITPIWQLEPGSVVSGTRRFDYDFAIVTDPLWALKSTVWFEVPECAPVARTIAYLSPRHLTPFRRWDVVLTPYTPADVAYRVTMRGNMAAIEMRGHVDSKTMLSDLNFLFPDGYALESIETQLVCAGKPHVVRWPENIVPLGAAAEGRNAGTLDEVLDETYALMRRWSKG